MSAEWVAFGAVLQALAFAGAAITLALGTRRYLALSQARHKHVVHQRDYERAEQMLVTAYHAKQALHSLRSTPITQEERDDADSQLHSNQIYADGNYHTRIHMQTAQIALTRLKQAQPQRDMLELCQFIARTLLCSQTQAQALQQIGEQFHAVEVASKSLMQNISHLSSTQASQLYQQIHDCGDLPVYNSELGCLNVGALDMMLQFDDTKYNMPITQEAENALQSLGQLQTDLLYPQPPAPVEASTSENMIMAGFNHRLSQAQTQMAEYLSQVPAASSPATTSNGFPAPIQAQNPHVEASRL